MTAVSEHYYSPNFNYYSPSRTVVAQPTQIHGKVQIVNKCRAFPNPELPRKDD